MAAGEAARCGWLRLGSLKLTNSVLHGLSCLTCVSTMPAAPPPASAGLTLADLLARLAAAPRAAPPPALPQSAYSDAVLPPPSGFVKIGTAFFGGRHRSWVRWPLAVLPGLTPP